MKRFSKLHTICAVALMSLGATNQVLAQGAYDYDFYDRYDNSFDASYQDFYDGLAPYGQWIYDPTFGYVWMPNVDRDFRPYYSNGYWAMTQYGNTWVSNYDWGWAPFHYGRWTYDGYYGWLWIPGNEWAPAWVSWRSNNNYYGWAPMGPGVNINISLGSIPVDWWTFCSPNYFYQPRFQRYCNTDWRFTRSVYQQTNYINYTYGNRRSFYTGPRVEDYRRHTGRQPSLFRVENNNNRGVTRVRGNNINMYRPSMRGNDNYAAPARIVQTDRRISARPETYNTSNMSIAGRDAVLNQTPIDNSRRSRSVNNNQEFRNENRPMINNEVRTNNNSNRMLQTEQNYQQRREDERNNRQMMEQQRAQQDAARQREKEQRDAFMIQERENERRRSEQTEESNRIRMQQMRDAQIQREREQAQQRQQQAEQQRRIDEQRYNQQQQRFENRPGSRMNARPAAPSAPSYERSNNKPAFTPINDAPNPSTPMMNDRSRETQMPEGRGLRGKN